MEQQLILLTAALIAFLSWMMARQHKVRRDQRLLALGIIPIERRKRIPNERIAIFLPRSDIHYDPEQWDLLVIEQEEIRQVDRYDLQHLHQSSGKSHYSIEAFSLTD